MQIGALVFLVVVNMLCATETRAQTSTSEHGTAAAQSYDRAEPPTPRPPSIRPEHGAWPFAAWSYAKAYTFNFFEDDYAQLQVVTEEGVWSPYIRSEQLVSETEARAAAELVKSVNGTFETTKCTFPRHAIVYFDQRDQPIASVDVCFECDAILVWPDYKSKDEHAYSNAAFMKTFDEAIAQFKVLFGKDLALPIDYKMDPRPGPSLNR